jgi:hypothetical protein
MMSIMPSVSREYGPRGAGGDTDLPVWIPDGISIMAKYRGAVLVVAAAIMNAITAM